MKAYCPAPKEVHDRITDLIGQHHPELEMVGVKIDVLMASTDSEESPAVSHSGYPAAAVVRVLDLKNRTMGRGDAEIVIDEQNFNEMTDAEKDALLDHEIYHLETKKDKYGKPKRDDLGRPCLGLRKHDRQFGWFDEIARRHGQASGEVQQATTFRLQAGQLYLDIDDTRSPQHRELDRRLKELVKPRCSVDSVTISLPSTGAGVLIDKNGITALKTA